MPDTRCPEHTNGRHQYAYGTCVCGKPAPEPSNPVAMLMLGQTYKCPCCNMPFMLEPEAHLPNCGARLCYEENLRNQPTAPEPSTCYITCPDCKRIHKLGECAQPPITVEGLAEKLLELMQRFPVQVGRCKKIARELKASLKGRTL